MNITISRTICAMAVGFIALTMTALGDGPYYFTATDDQHSINTPSLWENSSGETLSSISPDEDYVIPAGKTARVTTDSFVGKSLTVGDANGAATLLNKYYSTTYFATFNNLVLRNGTFLSVNGTATDRRARVDGKITVLSEVANPFMLMPKDNNSDIGFWLKADIVGEEGSALKLYGSVANGDTLTLSGDNSGYHGSITVKSFKTGANVDDWSLIVDSPTALGGSLASPAADAVLLEFGSTAQMTLTANAEPTIAAENRGITLSGNSAGLKLAVEEGADVELALPIAGDGSVRKTGLGTLTLSGEFTASGAISCEEGSLVLASETALAKAGTIGGAVSLRVPADGEFAAAGVVFNAAQIVFRKDGAQVGTLVLDWNSVLNGKTALMFEPEADLSDLAAEGVLLVKVPTAVKTVTEDDFSIGGFASSFGLPRFDVEVRDLGEGVQGVYAKRLFPVVIRAEGDPSASDGATTFSAVMDKNGTPIWSSGAAVQSGFDYLLTANHAIRTTSQFDGESLTLAGSSILILKSLSQNIGLLRAYPGAMINNGNPQTAAKATLTGRLVVYGTEDSPVNVGDHASTAGTVLDCVLEGDGVLALVRNSGSEFHFTLSGESPDFRGAIRASAANPLALTVANPLALGGALETFNYRSLLLGDKATLIPGATMTLATENRGICIRDGVTMQVGEGMVFTVNEPMTYNGVLTKTGTGTLVLGGCTWFENATQDGVTDTPTANKNRIVLGEGEVQGASAAALMNVVLVAGGGSLRVDRTVDCGPLGLQLAGVDVSKSDLTVAMSTRENADVPLFTVDGATAEALEGKVHVVDPSRPSHKIDLSVDDATDASGRKTFKAHYTKGGLVLLVF